MELLGAIQPSPRAKGCRIELGAGRNSPSVDCRQPKIGHRPQALDQSLRAGRTGSIGLVAKAIRQMRKAQAEPLTFVGTQNVACRPG